MDKIGIDSLFPNSKFKEGALDVENLFPPECRLDTSLPYFNADELINERKQKIYDLHILYRKIFAQCIDDIKYHNSLDKTDTVFSVPEIIYMQPKYDSKDCLLYIQKKLRKEHLDTYIISHKDIFISWFNVEKNKEIDKVING